MSKKVLSLVLALVMVLGTFGTAFADTTEAVNPKLEALKDLGLVVGYEDGTFGELNQITRAEMATLVVRALGLEAVATASAGFPSQFSDMNGANVLWARGYVNVAAGQGIVNGYPEGTFLPAGNVTYAEAAAMLVRAANGMTAEEEAVAVWPTSYLAKAAQLGILDGVESIADFNAPALRGKLFEMVYNAVVNLQMGDYQVVKAIVLENYRVEKLNKDEVVVEIIEEVQRAKFVEESRDRDVRGDQLSLTIPAKLGDVEALLGRVANFTLDKAGNVIAISLDSTYKVEVLTEEDEISNRKFGSYTVELSERIDRKDDRIFRTYYNNEDYAYEDFVKELGRDAEVEYAKITTKNGKVVYIDAFNFDDIAPVKEVRADGATVVVYNDLREGTTKNISLKATDDILFVTEGNVSVGTREDIQAFDVIHEYDGGVIVRKDADVTGTYTKVTSNRSDEYFVVVGDEEYLIPANDATGKQAVYAYDEDEFFTLDDVRKAGDTLKDFKDEEVTILLDLTEKVQYIGAELELGEFVGIVTRVIGERVRVLKSDDKTYDYAGDLDTKVVGQGTGHRGLQSINAGDLVYMSVDGTTIEKIEVLTEAEAKVTALGEREIKLVGQDAKRLLSNTLYFRAEGTKYEALTAKQARDSYEKDDADVRAYVLNGAEAKALFGRRAPVDLENEAYVVVFTKIALTTKEKTHVVQFEGWANNKETEMKVKFGDKTTETLEIIEDVVWTGLAKSELRGKDIIKIIVTDDDNKDIKKVEILIAANDSANDVWEVVTVSRDRLTLKDANKASRTFYLKDAEEFAYNTTAVLSTADRVKIAQDGTSDYLDAVLVVNPKWDVSANKGTTPGTETGVVTYINPVATEYNILIDGTKIYTINANTILKDSTGVLGMGTSVKGLLAVNDQIKVEGDVITRLAKAADRAAAAGVDAQIEALTFADEANPTAGEITAVQAARTAYTNLTAAQKALVTKLSVLEAKEAIVSGSPAVAEAAAVKAVKDAVAENDKAKFIAALKNPLFTKYVAANDDAYWTARTAISTPATTALMDAQLVIVNDLAPLTALKAATTKTEFIAALKNAAFTNYKVANDDAYWLAEATIRAAGITTVAAANAELLVVNNVADVNAAIGALTNASVTITDAEAQPTVVLNVPATVNGVAFTFTAKTDDNATVAIDGGALFATVTRNATAGTPTITVTATKGAATATAVYDINVPAGATATDAVTVELQ